MRQECEGGEEGDQRGKEWESQGEDEVEMGKPVEDFEKPEHEE